MVIFIEVLPAEFVRRMASPFVVAFALIWACGVFGNAVSAGSHPNVLLILFDDMNDWIEPLHVHSQVVTPSINKLAARGMLFTNAMTNAPACNPSRTSLLSGRLPVHTGVLQNSDPAESFLDSVVSLPEYFGQHGFETYAFGKIFHKKGNTHNAFNVSFTPDFDFQESRRESTLKRLMVGKYRGQRYAGKGVKKELHDFKVAKAATKAIRKRVGLSGNPFFMAVGFHSTHLPFLAPGQDFKAVPSAANVTLPPHLPNDEDWKDIPPAALETQMLGRIFLSDNLENKTCRWQKWVKAYLAAIHFQDSLVGKLVNELDKAELSDNTVIVFTSDHGFHLGEKRHFSKYTLWERSLHVPLIIAAPAVSSPGSVSDDVVSLIDLFPTLVDLCQLPSATALLQLDGQSLMPQLSSLETSSHGCLTTTQLGHSWMTKRYHFIQYKGDCKQEELYDRKTDPNEFNNLAFQEPSPRIVELLQQFRRKIPSSLHAEE